MAAALMLSLFPFRARIKIRRELPEYVTCGQEASYAIIMVNQSGSHLKDLILHETLEDPRPDLDTLVSTPEPMEKQRNAWDRNTLYYRWRWLLEKKLKAEIKPARLPDLPPDQPVRISRRFTPCHRGRLAFNGFLLARPDPLGIFNRLQPVACPQTLLILPRLYSVALPELKSTRTCQTGGINLASSVGNSDEFISLRPYRPGDPLRNIHWRSYAKTGEPAVKEYEDEFFIRHALLMDTFCSSEDNDLFEAAVSVAASCVNASRHRESILDLMFVGDRIYSFASGRGLGRPEKMLEILACVEPVPKKNIQDLIPLIQRDINRFSGAVCVFLGWTEAHQKILRLFKQAGIPVAVFLISTERSKTEQEVLSGRTGHARIRVIEPGRIKEDLLS